MAPGYETLAVDDHASDEDIDFSDLMEEFEVQLEDGFETFVLVDGLPIVPEANTAKLTNYVRRKLNAVGKTKEDGIHMPLDAEGQTQG